MRILLANDEIAGAVIRHRDVLPVGQRDFEIGDPGFGEQPLRFGARGGDIAGKPRHRYQLRLGRRKCRPRPHQPADIFEEGRAGERLSAVPAVDAALPLGSTRFRISESG